jgi:hypothetical protein
MIAEWRIERKEHCGRSGTPTGLSSIVSSALPIASPTIAIAARSKAGVRRRF